MDRDGVVAHIARVGEDLQDATVEFVARMRLTAQVAAEVPAAPRDVPVKAGVLEDVDARVNGALTSAAMVAELCAHIVKNAPTRRTS